MTIHHYTYRNRYSARLLDDTDIHAFQAFKIEMLREALRQSKLDDKGIERIMQDTPAVEAPINSRQKIIFGLFNDDAMVGEIDITFSPKATLTGLHILPSHTGKRLANMLYEAGIIYLLEQTNLPFIDGNIEAAKVNSRRSAEWNGLVRQDVKRHFGEQSSSLVYRLDLDELRDFRQKQLETGSIWAECSIEQA